ncbi:MAG: preprotein translocase subunit SecY [Clostridiales bacterium]|nr:preprotein translocase subunit SecY [Clostridiales bacterium]
MFNTIKNALKTSDVRKRVLYTLLLIVIFRLGSFISVPTVDIFALNSNTESFGITQLINTISGGAFSNYSIFALTITPYITASIVIQLLAMIIPSLERLTKEGGEEGRNKINKYTKILTIVLALIEGLGLYLSFKSSGIFIGALSESATERYLTGFIVVLSFMAGTALLMWLGEQITNKGIGNGISMIIFVGIVSGLPDAIRNIANKLLLNGHFTTQNLIVTLLILVAALILVAGVIFVQQAERRVAVQYSKRVVGRKMMGAQNTHIPLKLAMAGVMPIIFASSFMTFPAMIIQIFKTDIATQTGLLAGIYKLSIATSTTQLAPGIKVPIGFVIANALIYLLLIVGFTFFYTYATFNPAEVSNNIKKNGGFIPGIRAGKPTTQYLSSIISKLTWFGGLFLALIAIIPMFARFGQLGELNLAFGGTSILIVVGVALETVQQLESQLVMKHYKGFLE